jgi:cell pole-organizing protein PopZ
MTDNYGEPSMEAILSSIKKIIAEDGKPVRGSTRQISKVPVATVEQSDSDEDVLELTQSEDSELLDNGKAEKLAQSFSVLKTLAEPGVAPQIVRAGETSLEGLVRDMLRPMLKDWLDANLPALVETMVSREIERITKKG